MKKKSCILITIAIVIVLSASCHKTCQCTLYNMDGTTTTVTQTNPYPSKRCNTFDIKVVTDSITTGVECL